MRKQPHGSQEGCKEQGEPCNLGGAPGMAAASAALSAVLPLLGPPSTKSTTCPRRELSTLRACAMFEDEARLWCVGGMLE